MFSRPILSHISAPMGRSWLGVLKLVMFAVVCVLPSLTMAQTRYVEGDVIVTFKGATSLDGAKTALSKKSLNFSKHFDGLSNKRKRQTGLVHHDKKTTAELIADLKNDPSVESVEPNYLRWVKAVPNDTRFAEQWPLQNTGQIVDGTAGVSGDDIKFITAKNLARPTSKEIVVAVIDTGVDFTHPELAPNMWVNPFETRFNNTDDDSNGYVDDVFGYDFVNSLPEPQDSGHHGTHVAGTIAALGNNQRGIVGINDRAKIMALKVSADGNAISTSAVIAALQYATAMKNKGVNIVAINASYGGGGNSAAESAAIKAAGDAGIIFCAAAGNDATNNDSTPSYPASYRLPNMIVVAASDQSDKLATFSNYGATTVDIAAPGTAILSTKPSVVTVQVGGTTYDSLPLTYSGNTTGVTGTVVDCGIGNPADFPSTVRGNIALIGRGTLTFLDKVTNAMAAGATAAIIYNNVSPGIFLGTLQTSTNWIPARAISQADGGLIKAALVKNGSISVTSDYQFLEGTSMATPHVTGSVAFAAMNFPGETVAQRIQRILKAVDVKPELTSKVATNGRLNLAKVVDADSNGIADWLEHPDLSVPTITSTSPLSEPIVGTPTTISLSAVGGTTPYVWTLDSGTLPAGLTLSTTGELSGTPSATGTFTFSALVKDASNATDVRTFKIASVQSALAVATSPTLPHPMARNAYSQPLAASGGAAPFTWTLTSGTLPNGLTLSSQGLLSGTATLFGSYEFTARVTDDGGASAEQSFTLVVDPQTVSITNDAALTSGLVTAPYRTTFVASNGNGGYTWSLTSGTLPAGLSFTSAGILSGTPTEAGSFEFTLHVTDSTDLFADKTFQLLIAPNPLTLAPGSTLIAAVKGRPYTQTLSATGGTAPYVWTYSAGTLPVGMSASSTGLISGTPSTFGDFTFLAQVTDAAGIIATRIFDLHVYSGYIRPVPNPIDFGTTTIGLSYTRTLSAQNYPSSFSLSGLPSGLTYSSTTGIISGRPLVSGTFDLSFKASNAAGSSAVVRAQLVVAALPENLIGSFTGIIDRDATANNGLGSRLTLTTSKTGYYTVKITTGATTKSAVGYMLATLPQISTTLGTSLLILNLVDSSNLIQGTHGTATVRGWRSTWDATKHPATDRLGYYSIGLSLTDPHDQGQAAIPQGSGYATFSVSSAGSLTVTGKTADGQAISSAGFIGPSGEIPVYTSLYSNLGSITGTLTLAATTPISDNVTSGPLTWSKPKTTTRTYPEKFGPLPLSAYGKYLASASSGKIVLGLPTAGSAALTFTDAGLADAALDPDISAFTYSPAYTVTLPTAGTPANPAKATLSINKNTGSITGTFALAEPSPVLARKVTYYGQIIRPASGPTKALGYFLLPQIPLTGQTISTSPLLSGGVQISQ